MLKKVSLSDQAYGELVKQIISGQLPGGTRLTEEKISVEFGISRTPVRDALKKLAAENMVESLTGGGYQVCELDAKSVAELFECRAGIELLALSTAIAAIPKQELKSLRKMLGELLPEGDFRDASLECDEALHELIAEHCGNRHLAQVMRQMIKRTAAFRHFRNYEQSTGDLTGERIRLVDAILAQNLPEATRQLRDHILAAVKMLK